MKRPYELEDEDETTGDERETKKVRFPVVGPDEYKPLETRLKQNRDLNVASDRSWNEVTHNLQELGLVMNDNAQEKDSLDQLIDADIRGPRSLAAQLRLLQRDILRSQQKVVLDHVESVKNPEFRDDSSGVLVERLEEEEKAETEDAIHLYLSNEDVTHGLRRIDYSVPFDVELSQCFRHVAKALRHSINSKAMDEAENPLTLKILNENPEEHGLDKNLSKTEQESQDSEIPEDKEKPKEGISDDAGQAIEENKTIEEDKSIEDKHEDKSGDKVSTTPTAETVIGADAGPPPSLVEVCSDSDDDTILVKVDPDDVSFESPAITRARAAKQKLIRAKADSVAVKRDLKHRLEFPAQKATAIGASYVVVCPICEEEFPYDRLQLYRAHLGSEHNINIVMKNKTTRKVPALSGRVGRVDSIPQEYFLAAVESPKQTPSVLVCGLCKRSCDSAVALRRHLARMHKEIASSILPEPDMRCGSCFTKFNDSIHLTLHCKVCKKRNASPETMLQLAQGTLYCEICQKAHDTINETQDCYRNAEMFRCLICLNVFLSPSSFYHHMKTYHRRSTVEICCPFCDLSEVATRDCFIHIIDHHYNPVLQLHKNRGSSYVIDIDI